MDQGTLKMIKFPGYFSLIQVITLIISFGSTTGSPGHHTTTFELDYGHQESSSSSQLLFGNLWKFNEYCGYRRDDQEIIQDEINIEALQNGTSLKLARSNNDHLYEQLLQVAIKAKQTLPMICSVTSWGYADNSTESDASIQVEANDESCSLSWFQSLNSPIFDQLNPVHSWGRIPAGHLFKQNIWLGDYDDCLRLGQENKLSPTRYCFGAFTNLRGKSISPNVNGFRVGFCAPRACNSRIILEQAGQLDHVFKISNGITGVSYLPKLLEHYRFTDVYCLPVEGSLNRQMPTDNLSMVIYIVSVVWLSMLVYGTFAGYFLRTTRTAITTTTTTTKTNEANLLLDHNDHKSMTTIIRKVFDLRANWTEFRVDSNRGQVTNKAEDHSKPEVVNERKKKDEGQLSGLNGVKVIAMNWLMLSHIYGLMVSYSINTFYDDNGHESNRWDRYQIIRALIYQGQHLTPAFFIISGLLAGRKYLVSLVDQTTRSATTTTKATTTPTTTGEGYKSIDFVKMILLRYIRLMPMYLIAYTFVKKFSHLMGSGPLWDYGVSVQSETRQCQLESWLIPILMISNFIAPFSHCIITGWHISNDFQIYLVLPFLLLIYRSKTLAKYHAGRWVALMAFILSHASHVYNWHKATNFAFEHLIREPFLFGSRLVVGRLAMDYVNPVGRIGSYFLGVILAEHLFFNPTARQTESTEDDANNAPTKKHYQLLSELNQNQDKSRQLHTTTITDGIELKSSRDENKIKHQQYDFKATLMFLVGLSLFMLSMLTVIAPNDVKFILGSHSKSLAYPAVRLIVELAWATLLFGLLRAKAWGSAWLKWPCWDQLIKLNYTIMLIHFIVARYVVQTQRQMFLFNYTSYFQLATYIILLTYVIGFIVHLSIEMPLNKLIRMYLISKINKLFR